MTDEGNEHIVATTHDRPIVFFDMDGTLADFTGYADKLKRLHLVQGDSRPDCWPHIFRNLKPVTGAVEAVKRISDAGYEVYIASTNPWLNDEGAMDKIGWIKRWFGGDGPENPFYKRVILTHHKELLTGDYLIDDWTAHGAEQFKGTLIRFGSKEFPDWKTVTDWLVARRSDGKN